MNQRVAIEQLEQMQGKPVVSQEDDKIGDFDGFFYDEPTGQPRWLAVAQPKLGGLLGFKYYLLPVETAEIAPDHERIRVPYSKETVTSSPEVEGEEITEEQEEGLYEYYHLDATSSWTTGAEEPGLGEATRGPEASVEPNTGVSSAEVGPEAAISRHEEEMRVGKRERERGHVRLRKWVETEPVSEDMTLRRETAHVEREAVDRPAPGAQIGEQEAEMTLHEEEPVVSKETIEKERVGLERDVEAETETVQGEVRKEHVEVEEDVDDAERHRRSA